MVARLGRMHLRRQVKDPVVLPVWAVSYAPRRVGDAAAGRLGHLGQRPQVVIDLLIRGLQHRRQHPAGVGVHGDRGGALGRVLLPHAGQHVVTVLHPDQVPLVEHHDGRASRDADAFGQALVLVRGPDRGVDDQDGDVGPLEGAQGTHRRVLLRAAVRLGWSPEAGSIDESDRSVGRLDHGVDGVPGGARHVVHDGALLAQQLVE